MSNVFSFKIDLSKGIEKIGGILKIDVNEIVVRVFVFNILEMRIKDFEICIIKLLEKYGEKLDLILIVL